MMLQALWLPFFQCFSIFLSMMFKTPLFIDHAFLIFLAFCFSKKIWIFPLFFLTSLLYGALGDSLFFTIAVYQLLAFFLYSSLKYLSRNFISCLLLLFLNYFLFYTLSFLHNPLPVGALFFISLNTFLGSCIVIAPFFLFEWIIAKKDSFFHKESNV